MKIYRVACPNDYVYNPESGFWELSFDHRPVAGVRCDDPVLGAELYNQSRARFQKACMDALHIKEKKDMELLQARRIDKYFTQHIGDFSELIKWVTESGDLEQQQSVAALLTGITYDAIEDAISVALHTLPKQFMLSYIRQDLLKNRLKVPLPLRAALFSAIEQHEKKINHP